MTPIWRRDGSRPNGLGLALSDYADAIREICTKRRIPVIDGFDLLRPDEGGMLDDGVHPNVEGARTLGLRMGERLAPILARGPSIAR